MPKHGNKETGKQNTRRVIPMEDETRDAPYAEYTYEDDEQQQKRRVPKALYSVVIILMVLILGLIIWMNRDNLTPENIGSWIKLQVMGDSTGDGFPVAITGSSVYEMNFTSYNGDAVVLSDTALTMTDNSGRQLLSQRHSFNEPAMSAAYGKYLLYNQGGFGYQLISGTEVTLEGTSEKEILAGAVSQRGRFALGVQGSDGASELNVYLQSGELQYNYRFAQDYITAVALNHDGDKGVVCTVRSEKGELISRLTLLDFSQREPLASVESHGNLLVAAFWAENNKIFAVGDTAMLAGSSALDFSEISYDGRQLTAFTFAQNKAYISVSAYEHSGASTLLIYSDSAMQPVTFEAAERIEDISVAGDTVGFLADNRVIFCDSAVGQRLGEVSVGNDAKALALLNGRTAYILGVSEIRTAGIE